MKSMKIAIAAIIVAALMVIPVALFAVDDTQSEAAPDYQQLTDLMADVNWELLMGLDYTKVSMTTNPDQVPDQTVSGTVSIGPLQEKSFLYLNKNFKFQKDAKVVVENGGALTLCPTQGFSFSCNDTSATLLLKAGSKIVVTSDDKEPSLTNTITEIPIEEDANIVFYGRYAYDKANWEFTFTVAKDSFVTDNTVAAQSNGKVTFKEESKLNVKASVDGMGDKDKDKVTASISVKANLNASADIPNEKETVNASVVAPNIDYNVNVTVPTKSTSSTKDLTVSVKGNSEITVKLADVYDSTVKNNTDVNVKVTNFVYSLDDDKTNDKDIKSSLNGSVSMDISTKGMDNYKPEGSDTSITVKDASQSYKLNLNNQDVSGEVNFNIGQYKIVTESETGNQVINFENLKFSGKYTGIINLENEQTPAVSAPLSLAKAPSPSSIVDEYMKGVADKKSADEIKKYAAEFFLGKMDQSSGFAMAGITSKSIKAEVSVGKADYGEYLVEGLNLNMEVSESVGAKASASLSKVTMNGGIVSFLSADKLTIGSTNVTIQTATDVENKAMFNVDFSTSAETKTYNYGNRELTSSMYVKDFKGKATIATKNKVDSLSIGEVSTTVYGVSAKASNITMDVEKMTFTAGEMKISGNYYGIADVRSVDGSYKNVTLSPQGLTLAPTAESVSLRIEDIDGDHMDFTRTYDATKKVITNTYDVDGQMYIANIINDDTLAGMMMAPITGADENATETNVFKGGVLVPGGVYISNEAPSSSIVMPGLTVTGKGITVDISAIPPVSLEGTAPQEVYVSNSTAYFPYTGPGCIKVDGITINIALEGASLGVKIDENGAITYSLLALPGYTLSKDMTCSGFTIGDINDKKASITRTSDSITCTAIPVKYKLSIDGKEVSDKVEYAKGVSGEGLDKDVLYLVDENGAIVADVNDGAWNFTYYFTKDVNLKTTKVTKVTTVETTKINEVASEGAAFTVPATGGSSLSFALSSKVRFDLIDLEANDNVNLVAQKTNFNGHDGFIIKAASSSNGYLPATLYIPVSGEGQKLMHVDEYGRVSERQADTVVIDGQTYLKAYTNDYSIFYADADNSPVVDNGGSGGISPVLIIVGIVAVVAVIGVAVFFVKKN